MISERQIKKLVKGMGHFLTRDAIEAVVKEIWDRDASDFWTGHSGQYVEPVVDLIEAILDKAKVT